MPRLFVVVSGLPASGKTTLARRLGPLLGLPVMDKDDILEALLEAAGVADPERRRWLSRASDLVLQNIVQRSAGAVVTSFWRRERLSGTSGTPTRWLLALPDADLVEVACVCSPAVAVRRFQTRQRHPGHLDSQQTAESLLAQFEALSADGPLDIGPTVLVDTTGEVDARAIATAVTTALEP